MAFTIFNLLSIIGLISIIIGVILINEKLRKYQYIAFIIGGICLEIYSLYLADIVFIILQAVFTLSAIYGLIRTYKS